MLGLPAVGGIPANLAEQPEWESLEGYSKLVRSASSIGHFFSCTPRPKLLQWLLGLAPLPSLLPPPPAPSHSGLPAVTLCCCHMQELQGSVGTAVCLVAYTMKISRGVCTGDAQGAFWVSFPWEREVLTPALSPGSGRTPRSWARLGEIGRAAEPSSSEWLQQWPCSSGLRGTPGTVAHPLGPIQAAWPDPCGYWWECTARSTRTQRRGLRARPSPGWGFMDAAAVCACVCLQYYRGFK